ncbi:MAG TPA: hypothetical protein DCX89_07285 [Saprospirales bacterium]|nr:hypothetical protein [Saprospirales bacterium]HAY71679.1 hypothetical protein [Saprospirales bacterium]HRQ29107.1 hypothetical protein [Saprospiraceae bacterium]
MEDLRDELKNIGSRLDPAGKNESWDIPEGYFGEMQNMVLVQLHESKSNRPNVNLRNLRSGLYAVSGIAAMLILAFGIWFFAERSHSIDPAGIQELDQDQVYAYLEENIDEISLDMLMTDKQMESEILFDQPQSEEDWDVLLEDVDLHDLNNIF